MLEDLEDIDDMPKRAELIIEVAHPNIWKEEAENLLKHANVLIGSSSGMSVESVEDNVRNLCKKYNRTAFVARGALWGSEDVVRMADQIKNLTITMKKHPSHLKGSYILIRKPFKIRDKNFYTFTSCKLQP